MLERLGALTLVLYLKGLSPFPFLARLQGGRALHPPRAAPSVLEDLVPLASLPEDARVRSTGGIFVSSVCGSVPMPYAFLCSSTRASRRSGPVPLQLLLHHPWLETEFCSVCYLAALLVLFFIFLA